MFQNQKVSVSQSVSDKGTYRAVWGQLKTKKKITKKENYKKENDKKGNDKKGKTKKKMTKKEMTKKEMTKKEMTKKDPQIVSSQGCGRGSIISPLHR